MTDNFQLTKPVAFLIFNRPDTTMRVFEEIRRARPPKLLVVADGPRAEKLGEPEKCQAARTIIDTVDWPCEVLKNYSETNLGCKIRVSSGLDWVFKQVEEAIILEDDCLPHPSFFRFCEELLAKYRRDERISMISGANFQFGHHMLKASYYFSRYNHIWGWASWRRAWEKYDRDVKSWPEIRDAGWLESVIFDRDERMFWTDTFQAVYEGKIDTWDHQWNLVSFYNNTISIIPSVNLISNIGFGIDATHTRGISQYANMPSVSMSFPLIHPNIYLPYYKADRFTAENMFLPSMTKRIWHKLKAIMQRYSNGRIT